MVSVLSEEIRWAFYGLIGPSGSTASHVSEDPLEQVRPHLVSYLISYLIHVHRRPRATDRVANFQELKFGMRRGGGEWGVPSPAD